MNCCDSKGKKCSFSVVGEYLLESIKFVVSMQACYTTRDRFMYPLVGVDIL